MGNTKIGEFNRERPCRMADVDNKDFGNFHFMFECLGVSTEIIMSPVPDDEVAMMTTFVEVGDMEDVRCRKLGYQPVPPLLRGTIDNRTKCC